MKYSKKYLKDNFVTKFRILLDSRYQKFASRKRRNEFCKDYDNAFSDEKTIEQSCKNWFAHVSTPDIERLTNICSLLNCDIDYFLTEQNDFQKEPRSASDYLGLSYDTVDIISNFSPEQKQILDLLTLSDKPTNLGELLKDIYSYTQSSMQHGTVIDDAVEDTDKKQRNLHGDELLMIRRFDISNKISNMLESLRALYWNRILRQSVEIQKKQNSINMEHFAKVLREHGFNEKDIEKRISEVSASSAIEKLYDDLKN